MCNIGDGIWEEAEAITKKKERKNVTAAFTSYMISEFGLSKEEAENKTNEFISSLDKDTSLVM